MKTKISTFQLILLSTGSIIGAGWLFAPFYGFQIAGVGVIISWIITAIITFIIALSFAEVSGILPIVGGLSRFIGITHNKNMAFVFLGLSWLSYVVYLPIEAQSAIQYLGFFFNPLVVRDGINVCLSSLGLCIAFLIIIALTWFNCMVISKVAKANSWVSVWKLIVPIGIAIIFIISFGKWDNVINNYHQTPLSLEKILLAITSSGIAFAFAGFQNGLILARNTKNPNKALPASLFMPIIIGSIIYLCLSMTFIACLTNTNQITKNTVAPLLGLVSLFGMHTLYLILFIDAVIAPLGTANVYTAVTGRILYGLGHDFLPNSILMRLNKYSAPHVALWISAIVGMCFLLPFPTWKELVNFLSSITVFAYLAGPITLIILRKEFPNNQHSFKIKYFRFIGYTGFICCSLLIYWSGFINLLLLSGLTLFLILLYNIFSKKHGLLEIIKNSCTIIIYLFSLSTISYLHFKMIVSFPIDNLLVSISGFIFCNILVKIRLDKSMIENNLNKIKEEIRANGK